MTTLETPPMFPPVQPAAELSFWTPGQPKTAGSKTAITKGKGGVPLDKPVVVDSGNRADKRAWRADLRAAAQGAAEFEPGKWPTEDALDVLFVFVRRRPGGHLRTGKAAGVVKDWAVGLRPVARPDGLKLARASEDALTGILWADDSQIVDGRHCKAFGDQVGLGVRAEGCLVVVRRAGGYDGPPIVPTLASVPAGVYGGGCTRCEEAKVAVATLTTPEQEEREARRKLREGQTAERRMREGRARKARAEAQERRRRARAELAEMQPALRVAAREYVKALADATRERRGDTAAEVGRRFDVADGRMSALAGLARRAERLRRESHA